MRPLFFAVALASLAAACARGQSDYVGEPGSSPGVAPTSQDDGGGTTGANGNASGGAGGTSSGASGGTSGTSGGTSGTSGTTNGGGSDAGTDAAKQDAAPGADAGGLDPLLSLPDPSGAPCVPGVGSEIGCPLASVCRLASPTGGRCESCTDCGNLKATCSSGSDCDIVFECYAGRCTNFCQLGTYNCGAIADCLNVGHPTIGVCRP